MRPSCRTVAFAFGLMWLCGCSLFPHKHFQSKASWDERVAENRAGGFNDLQRHEYDAGLRKLRAENKHIGRYTIAQVIVTGQAVRNEIFEKGYSLFNYRFKGDLNALNDHYNAYMWHSIHGDKEAGWWVTLNADIVGRMKPEDRAKIAQYLGDRYYYELRRTYHGSFYPHNYRLFHVDDTSGNAIWQTEYPCCEV